MNEWFTSDTHFGHHNIIEYCKRPFASVEEMNRAMIERWNSVVGPADLVYHLGDFALGPKVLWEGYRNALNGRIMFFTGNHDDIALKAFDAMLKDDIDDKAPECLRLGQPRVHMAHIPPAGDPLRGYTRPMKYDVDVDVYLCGHVHEAWETQTWKGKPVINVGVDVWDFTPQPLERILSRA